MPNWKTHLEVGKRLQETLKYNEEDYNLFLLGNILPDINNCYIVKNISKKLPHHNTHFTHYGYEETPSYVLFEKNYSYEIKTSPLVYGYFIHLFTDYSWNNDFYTKLNKRGIIEKDPTKLRIMKQDDFKVFNNKFRKNTIEINNYERTLNEIKIIKEISITKKDLIEVKKFLDDQGYDYERKYQAYKEEELDYLLSNTVKDVIEMKNSGVIKIIPYC